MAKRFYSQNIHGDFEADTLPGIKKQLKPFGRKHHSGFGNISFIIYDRKASISNRGIKYSPAPPKTKDGI